MNLEEILTRGVAQVLPSKKALVKLMQKKRITLYQGFDPSSPRLHLGNLIGIRKLAQFQALGHKVIFLIGDFTGMIGDPTDKSAVRKKLTHKQVLDNAKDYKKQVEKILNFTGPNKAEILFNSKWLANLKFEEVIKLASNFTVQQMLERDFFQERLKKKKPIYLHEFLYPLMQGYDCVAMNVDLEIGGNDQLFNMLAGRALRKALNNTEKYVLTLKLLEDPTGRKMGKTEGNTINLTDSANEIFGKVMAVPDSLIKTGIELLTDLPLASIRSQKPMAAKKRLAWEVVNQIYSETQAQKAQQSFEQTFQKRNPSYQKQIPIQPSFTATIALAAGASISQAKRWIKQGAVDVNKKSVTDLQLKLKTGDKIKVGKKTFATAIKK
jgi:tyrosyl-tRNA synthetase